MFLRASLERVSRIGWKDKDVEATGQAMFTTEVELG